MTHAPLKQSADTVTGHARWVRLAHWLIAASVLTLATSGFFILQAHPRLYWGTVGNDLTPALVELPISRNYKHGGWTPRVAFYADAGSPVTAERTYDIYNENGWARSLHFLAAWFLVLSAAFYSFTALFSGHLRRDLLPRPRELSPGTLWQSVANHARTVSEPGPPYNALQKLAYSSIILLAIPMMVLTGMTMSPALNAALPFLSVLFGGSQSARTLHFGIFVLLVLFVVGHVTLVVVSGFTRQLKAMTWGART